MAVLKVRRFNRAVDHAKIAALQFAEKLLLGVRSASSAATKPFFSDRALAPEVVPLQTDWLPAVISQNPRTANNPLMRETLDAATAKNMDFYIFFP